MLDLVKKTFTTKKTTFEGTLTGKDLIKAFGLPEGAKVEFFVPGGGDWSNEIIEIDEEHPVYITYSVEDVTEGN